MKEQNSYTLSLCSLGLLSLMFLFWNAGSIPYVEVLFVLVLIIMLDLFPVRLPSGDQYSGGIIGVFILLLAYGIETALMALYVSTFLYYLKTSNWNIRKLARFRLLTTWGMYSICLLLCHILLMQLGTASLYIKTALGIVLFEMLNIFLIAGIRTTVGGSPFFENIHFKFKEILIPALLGIAVIPHFVHHLGTEGLFSETIYTSVFLFFILFFSREFLKQYTARKKASEEFVRLAEVKQEKDSQGHGNRIGVIMESFLDEISYSKSNRSELVMSAILHDIGKTLIPAHVFRKRGALSLTEEAEYRSHTEFGAQILFNITGEAKIADWIRYHHERFDGKGYPKGLKGKEIPYEARIITLCNELDHLMMRYEDDGYVASLLQEMAGKVLDPALAAGVEVSFVTSIRQALVFNREEPEEQPQGEEFQEDGLFIGGTSLIKYTPGISIEHALSRSLADQIAALADRSLNEQQTFYEIFKESGKTYEVHFYPESENVSIVLTDITPAVRYREKMHEDILHSYKGVIETLSHSKVDLCLNREEIEDHLGRFVGAIEVKEKSDVAASRNFVAEHCAERYDAKRIMHIKLAVSEGVTNLIKHAVGGRVSIYEKQGMVQIFITDRGSGIPLHELPKTILVSGYSSKRSLGKGFALMHASADRLLLHTYGKGTSLLLEFEAAPSSEQADAQSAEKKESQTAVSNPPATQP